MDVILFLLYQLAFLQGKDKNHLMLCCPTKDKGAHASCLLQNFAPPLVEFPAKQNVMMTSISNVQHII